ncbi:MAG: hypothetical protein ACR2MB_15795 [Acidimicrobiales bacterium]
MSVNVDEVLQRVRDDLERVQSAVHRTGSIAEAFEDEVRVLLGDAEPELSSVRRAARLAVAEQAWEQRLGMLLDGRDVEQVLGVTRQRVSVLARQHRLVVVPGEGGRRRFPAWQFARLDGVQRAALGQAQHVLVSDGGVSPWSAASWLVSVQAELDSATPAEYVTGGGDLAHLAAVAARDAARSAQ